MIRFPLCAFEKVRIPSLALFILCGLQIPSLAKNTAEYTQHAQISTSTNQKLTLSFRLEDVQCEEVISNGDSQYSFKMVDEGYTLEHGRPKLPAVSRTVIVPADTGLEFVFSSDEPRVEMSENPPVIFTVENQMNRQFRDIPPLTEIYPSVVAAMSEPFIIRGVRMVRVTTYPVRYDPVANTYLYYNNIETEIRFTNDEPVNPVHHPERRNRSVEFLRFIEAFALNGSDISRDDPGRDEPDRKPGHYLIVTHENCLEFVAPFIEWRRKGGYKVEILSLNPDEAANPNIVEERIQEIYNGYLEEGIDPFDHILLVGDREDYTQEPDAQWVLGSHAGSPVSEWDNHADYLYACLEGNDQHMDAAIARFPAGNPETLQLVIGRTLAYEAEPFMDDPTWFTKGAAFSQHWGHGNNTAWTPYIHTCVRWGEEVLRRRGFDYIAFYEESDWDQQGQRILPFLRGVYNEGRNVLAGIAQNYAWRREFAGVENNVIFPIHLTYGDWTNWIGHNMFRTGDGDNLKGPVAITATWGLASSIEPQCVMWLGLVSAFMNHDMTLGWSRVYAVTDLESYYPNIDIRDQPLYEQIKTDLDVMGDPGIKAWIGVPQLVEAQISHAEISPTTNYIEVIVTDAENGEPVSGATVSIYAPGEIPAPEDADYAVYDEMMQITSISGEDGIAEFYFGEEVEFIPDTPLYYTVTGRDIRPFFSDAEIVDFPVAIEVMDFEIVEIEGDGDLELNPGESFGFRFTARNISEEDAVNRIVAVVSSSSEWVVVDENEIDLGDIAAREEVVFDQGVPFTLTTDCPDGEYFSEERPRLQVEFTSGEMRWESAIEIDPVAPAFALSEIEDGEIIPFDIEEMDIEIRNMGGMAAGALTAELHSVGNSLFVIRGQSSYPNIEEGQENGLVGDSFLIFVNQQAVPGSKVEMTLLISSENGFHQEIPFTLQLEVQDDDWDESFPQAPDDYGYICFDYMDEDWFQAPVYDWVEISQTVENREFDGILLDFVGRSQHDIGEAIVVGLPFEFQFYDETFDRITVCEKGFIAMGEQPRITNYQPTPLDRAMGGGVGMIAPFWGDLEFDADTGIYVFYDEDGARFIIEWFEITHRNEDPVFLTFQIILYDPAVWINPSGDGDILFQYRTIADPPNVRGEEWTRSIPHAAVGISSPDGTTGINYSFNSTVPESSVRLRSRMAILFSTNFEPEIGILHGFVADLETGDPIGGARIETEHGLVALSNEEGYWIIQNGLARMEFSITCGAPGYNDATLNEGFIVEEGDSLEINFELLHPEFECSDAEVREMLREGGVGNWQFEVINSGNGPLEWETLNRWREGDNFAPWELRRQLPVGEILDDSRIQGVVFVDDRFYVAGSNNREPQIYVLNREGELIHQYDQFAQEGYGYKDMAFDGEWIWGSGSELIHAFTPEGELMREFEGPFDRTNNFAWDLDRELLWVSWTTSNIIAIDREGNQFEELDRLDMRTYGLSYYPDDIDGYPLYIFHRDHDLGDQVVTKMNPENNDTMFVRVLDPPEGGRPLASFCSDQYDPRSWVFMAVSNRGPDDRIDIWQIESRIGWLNLEPESGVINADEFQDFTLTLDASELEAGTEHDADIRFYHNAAGGVFDLPVTLIIANELQIRNIDLDAGWNLVSLNIEPETNNVPALVRQIVVDERLVILKNGLGQFYLPAQEFCNIRRWEVTEGYQFKLNDATRWEVNGDPVLGDRPIPLREGWNMSAYFPRQDVNVEIALAGIAENLILAKDELGRFYYPESGFNNMGNLEEGMGYQYNVREEVELVYQIGEEVALANMDVSPPEYFGYVLPTGNNMSILLTGDASMAGCEVACYSPNGLLIGSGCFDSEGYCGIAVWGDDITTDDIDGAIEGEHLLFVLHDGTEEKTLSPDSISGEPVWSDGGFMLGEINSKPATPVTFGIHEAFPNPTNGPVGLSFGLEKDAVVSLKVYDLSGRLVRTLAQSEYKAGNHQVVWNTDVVSSGLYIVKMTVPGRSHTVKIAVLK